MPWFYYCSVCLANNSSDPGPRNISDWMVRVPVCCALVLKRNQRGVFASCQRVTRLSVRPSTRRHRFNSVDTSTLAVFCGCVVRSTISVTQRPPLCRDISSVSDNVHQRYDLLENSNCIHTPVSLTPLPFFNMFSRVYQHDRRERGCGWGFPGRSCRR